MWKYAALASMLYDGFATTVASAAQLVPVWAELRRSDPALLREIYGLMLTNTLDQFVKAIPVALVALAVTWIVRLVRRGRYRSSPARPALAA